PLDVTLSLRRETKKGRRAGPVSLYGWTCGVRRAIPWDDPFIESSNLFGGLGHHIDRHVLSAQLAVVESHFACGEREEGMILANAHVDTRVHLGPALAHD